MIEFDENKISREELQVLINEQIERVQGIMQMHYGVSKTSFYKMVLQSSSLYRNAVENLHDASSYYNAAKAGISLSGKADTLQNYFESSDDLQTAIEEITND
jgi:hypothetical protein